MAEDEHEKIPDPKPQAPTAPEDGTANETAKVPPSGGLLSHFVRRTDDAFRGVEDKSLIGEDVGWAEDELDEDGEPLKP